MEYKFRGFDATGQKGWVYGDLVHNQKVTRTGLEPRVMVGGYEVVPESVGICTGMKDDYGEMLYEGDICKVAVYGRREKVQLFYFEKKGQFLLGTGSLSFPITFTQTCAKIGNIFENKDLLKNESLD